MKILNVQDSISKKNTPHYSRSLNTGFTLIELLVVITVIGVLASAIFANFVGARQRSRDTARKSDFRQLKTALRIYYNDYQTYPTNTGGATGGELQGCGTAGLTTCGWGEAFTAAGTQYMARLPIDPLNRGTNFYRYRQTDGGDGFELITYLENGSDPDAANSQMACDPAVTSPTDPDIVELKYIVCED